MPLMYTMMVYRDSIIKEMNVTSISTCFFHCLDDVDECVAVEFSPNKIRKRSEQGQVTCHLMREGGSGEKIQLETFVSDNFFFDLKSH